MFEYSIIKYKNAIIFEFQILKHIKLRTLLFFLNIFFRIQTTISLFHAIFFVLNHRLKITLIYYNLLKKTITTLQTK